MTGPTSAQIVLRESLVWIFAITWNRTGGILKRGLGYMESNFSGCLNAQRRVNLGSVALTPCEQLARLNGGGGGR